MAEQSSLSQFRVHPAASEAAELSRADVPGHEISLARFARRRQAMIVEKYLSAFVAEADSHLSPSPNREMPLARVTHNEIAGFS